MGVFVSNTCMLPVVLCSVLRPSRLHSPRISNTISNPGLNVLLAVRGRFEAGTEHDCWFRPFSHASALRMSEERGNGCLCHQQQAR